MMSEVISPTENDRGIPNATSRAGPGCITKVIGLNAVSTEPSCPLSVLSDGCCRPESLSVGRDGT